MNNQLPTTTFLGPKGEQRVFFTELINLITNDYVYWRRNYFPRDPPALSYSSINSEYANSNKDKFMDELFKLISDLKLDPPFFSPRYMAHMLGEVSLPSLLAYYATMLYNPNNVSLESSPVTIEFEIQVRKDFSKLFGWDELKSFGNLTSGGTLANYQSIFYHKTAKLLPVAIAMAAIDNNVDVGLPNSLWELLNIPEIDTPQYVESLSVHSIDFTPYTESFLGERDFIEKAESIFNQKFPKLVIVLPKTAHYSWSRAARLFSIGTKNLVSIEIAPNGIVSTDSLKEELDRCLEQKLAIIQVVAIFGTTEFGGFDPIDDFTRLRSGFEKRGLYFPIHVDAAYGGYFQSMFVAGEKNNNQELLDDPYYENLKKAAFAITDCDSLTIDPHKLGLTPYGVGVFLLKNGFLKDFVTIDAHYVFNQQDDETSSSPQLGKYILEGSRPGAAAAAVYFSNKMIPLNFDGHGPFLYELVEIARDFISRLHSFNQKQDRFKFVPVITPQSNVVTFIVIQSGSKTLEEVNELNSYLIQCFGVKDKSSIHHYKYLVSHTLMNTEGPPILKIVHEHQVRNNIAQLSIIRSVFMNLWVKGRNEQGIEYLDDFLEQISIKVLSYEKA